jgi:putative ABC transport system permease protein
MLQVALAVGTLLALLSLGTSVADTTRAFFDDSKWDVWATTYASRPFDADAARVIAATPGVQRADPLLTNAVKIEGRTGEIWGVSPRPMYRSPIAEGRYFSAAEQRAGRPVAVVARSLAGDAGASVGDTVTLQTAAGPARLRVVGIAEDQSFQGRIVFLPIRSAQAVLRSPGQVNNYMIASRSPDHAAIDRLNTRLEDTLGATGNQITTSVLYVDRRDVVAMNSSIANTITGLGLLIVLISMVGLVNAITMGVIERTREVGMLRCIGARGRDVRRIFAVEGLVVAVLGWLAGVPLGYAMAHGVVRLTESTVGLDLTFAFPAVNLLVTLAGTLVLALLVLLAPVRRAVRLRPGDALRYA